MKYAILTKTLHSDGMFVVSSLHTTFKSAMSGEAWKRVDTIVARVQVGVRMGDRVNKRGEL